MGVPTPTLHVVPPTLPVQVTAMLGKVDSWQFNAFSLHEVSGGRPLSMLSFFLFKRFEVGQGLPLRGGWEGGEGMLLLASSLLCSRGALSSFATAVHRAETTGADAVLRLCPVCASPTPLLIHPH